MAKDLHRPEWAELSDKHLAEARGIAAHPDVPVTQSAYARYIGVSPGRVSQLVKEGAFELTGNRRIIPRQADRARSLSMKVPDDIEDGNDLKETLLRHKVDHEREKARLSKLKADEQEKMLIPASDVSRYVFDVGRTIRTALQTIPIRISAELSGITEAFLIQQILEKEIEAALRKLSETFEAGKLTGE